MILDSQNLMSDQQAIVATAVSTNVLDLRPVGIAKKTQQLVRDIGSGSKVPLLIQVTEDFDALTSLTIDLQVSADEAFSSPISVVSESVLLADLLEGRQSPIGEVPIHTDQPFMRMAYTVVGSNPTVGKITAGISGGNATNNNTY